MALLYSQDCNLFIGLDPGPVTGWASANPKGHMVGQGQVPIDELPHFLDSIRSGVAQAVCEAYVPRKGKWGAHVNKPMTTSEVVGIIRSWSSRKRVPLEMQDASILGIAEKMTGMPVPKGKAHGETHWIAAWNHLQYWMIRHGLAKTLLEMQNEG